MTEITETDVAVEEVAEAEAVEEYTHFELDEPLTIEIGETAGNPVTVEAQYFIVASVFDTQEVGEMEAAMSDMDEGDLMVTDEASVFVSNADGEMGGGVATVSADHDGEDEPSSETTVDGAIEEFKDEHLDS